MRPIKLVMSAFGPYSSKTEIDFRKFNNNGIFLITGNTGSGKSSIFDAISYALYGEGSCGQERRSSKSFRSDYAPLDIKTYVEFEFSHKDKLYKIVRSPEYIRMSKRGSGMVTESAACELTDYSNCKIYTTIATCNQAIYEILGLTRDQFSQTVMIAQGDFLKILNAKSDDRKKLFQKIFNTTLYGDLQSVLKEENSKYENKYNSICESIDREIKRIMLVEWYSSIELKMLIKDGKLVHKIIPELEKLNEQIKIYSEKLQEKIDTKKVELDSYKEEIIKGKNINKLFLEKEKIENILAKLKNKKEEYLNKEIKVTKAKKALNVLPYEKVYLQSIKQHEINLDRISSLEKLYKTAEEEYNDLLSYKESIYNEYQTLEENYKLIESYNRLIPVLKEYKFNLAKYETQKTKLDELNKKSKAAENNYIDVRTKFLHSQGYILSLELKDNEPCPVCGSKVHPDKAKKTNDIATKEDLEKADKQRKLHEENLNEVLTEIETLQVRISSSEEQIKEAGFSLSFTAIELAKIINQLTSKTESIKKRYDLYNKNEKSASDKLLSLKTNIQSVTDDNKSLEKSIEKQKLEFDNELTNQGFASVDEYKDNFLTSLNIDALEEDIKVYKDLITKHHSELETIDKQIDGKEKVDIIKLESELYYIQNDYNQNMVAFENNNLALKTNQNCYSQLKALNKEMGSIMKKWIIVNDLYKATSGQISKQVKISFETYVQQYYFKQVVIYANKRLDVLANGMFKLRCKDEAKNKRSQVGLDLEVFDANTQVWRDANTLSGGESFMASLSLALGLSDVVQSQTGNVRLESLFIDEGFGSLDEESLKQALELLNKLADGNKLVGIISHVNELKEKIEQKIIVTKRFNGSKIIMEY